MTRLRAARPDEAALLARWRAEPASPYEDWSGAAPPGADTRLTVPAPDGGGELVVTDLADVPLGTVSWRSVTQASCAGRSGGPVPTGRCSPGPCCARTSEPGGPGQ